jgi:hypothetical protein
MEGGEPAAGDKMPSQAGAEFSEAPLIARAALQATCSGANARPADFRLDGAACAVVGPPTG